MYTPALAACCTLGTGGAALSAVLSNESSVVTAELNGRTALPPPVKLDQSTVSVLNQSTVSVLNQRAVSGRLTLENS
jgi:hypothetical protein